MRVTLQSVCRHCGSLHNERSTFCAECGRVLESGEWRALELPENTIDYLVGLRIEGDDQTVKLRPGDRITIGRDRESNPHLSLVDIDLEPYNAAEEGVSRVHAYIQYGLKGIQIIDLNSRNGTFINGHRLDPFIPAALQDHDRLQFGQFQVTVYLVAVQRQRTQPRPTRPIPQTPIMERIFALSSPAG
jgi:pSer/pThr/pTyr-binding forkhead associated (FHA) protein